MLKKQLLNESCNFSTKTKAWPAEELITSIKSSFEPDRLHRRERLSELIGMNNHSMAPGTQKITLKWLMPLL